MSFHLWHVFLKSVVLFDEEIDMILRISKNDIKIILLCSIIFFGAFLVLYFDLFANLNEKSDRPFFAKAVVVDNDVRKKSDQQLAWAKSSTQDLIRYGDQIFTGEKSNVVLELEGNQRIKIQENSLVKFEQKKNVKNFKIMFGSMTTQVKKGELIEVIICGEKIKIEAQSDDEMKISNNDNCVKPEVKLNNEKQKVTLKPKKRQIAAATKAIIEKSIEPVVVDPVVPPPEPMLLVDPSLKKQTYKFMSTDAMKKIEWSDVENADSYSVKIYDSENSNNIISDFEVKSASFDFKPTDLLNYSFSVQARSQDKLFLNSNITTGGIEINYPPIKMHNPEKSYTFEPRTSDQKLPQIDHPIRWSAVPQAAYYQLEIADNSDFTNVIQTEKLKKNSFAYPLKETGKLFYRVKAYSKNQKELTRSTSTSYMEYIKNFDLVAPSLVSQMKDQVFFFQNTQGQFIRLAWQNKQVEKAPNYYVEMSTSKDFGSVYRKFNADRPYILLSESIPQGFYYWRVRSYGESIVSDWSETGTLKVQTKRAIAEDKKN